MEQDHNPQNSMSLSERKTSLSVRSQEERDGNGSLKPAPAPVGGFSQGCGGHGQGFAPVTEALRSFLPPDSDCKWRTDAAQLQHPGEDMPTAKQLADFGYKTFSASMMLLTVYGGYLCSVRAYRYFQLRSARRQAAEEQKTSGVL